MNEVVDLNTRRSPVIYDVTIAHHYDGTLEFSIHNVADDPRSRDAVLWAFRRISGAEERIAELEAALRPFAELGEVWLPEDDKDDSIWVTCPDDTPVNNLTNFGFNFGHFRTAARAALAGEKKE